MKTLSAKPVVFLLVLAFFAATNARAQDYTTNPEKIFAGCDTNARAPQPAEDPLDTINAAAPAQVVDRVTERAFASFTLDEIEAGEAGELTSLCWARLDGVWRDETPVVSDTSRVDMNAWDTTDLKLLAVTNGAFTTPRHIVVVQSPSSADALYLATGMTGSPFVRFESRDGVALEDVLKRGGTTKTYAATSRFEYGNRLRLSVERSGRILMSLDGRAFYRPKPNASLAEMEEQLPSDNPFWVDKNLGYLAASRRGYDIVTQDPFYLYEQNPKLEIFKVLDPQQFYVDELKVVPLNFKYVPLSAQGMIFRKSLVASETTFQQSNGHTFGVNATIGNPKLSHVTAGYKSARSSMRSLEESASVAQAIGYSRYKKYALVLDMPFVELSDAFVDAVEQARVHHRYQALIDKFGTHYPYAVTYGSSGQLTFDITTETYKEMLREKSSFGIEAGGGYAGVVAAKASYGQSSSTTEGSASTVSSENFQFFAVGGNGSWDEKGFSAGEQAYPILLDLRPIWELLNPMTFPGEPEVYQTVRKNLRLAIDRYLGSFAQSAPLSASTKPLPTLEPEKVEPVEEWHVYVRQAWCTGDGVGKVKRAIGEVTIHQGDAKTRTRRIDVECKKNYDDAIYSYKYTDPMLLRIIGTRSAIEQMKVTFDMKWKYDGTLWGQEWNRPDVLDPFGTSEHPLRSTRGGGPRLAVGKRKDYVWTVGKDKWPDLRVRLRFKRIR